MWPGQWKLFRYCAALRERERQGLSTLSRRFEKTLSALSLTGYPVRTKQEVVYARMLSGS